MDILPSQIIADLAVSDGEDEDDDPNGSEEVLADIGDGPWVLAVTAQGYGKRIPVDQFRLQKRAGLGLRAIKFRVKKDELVALGVVNQGDELMLITHRGIIIQQVVDAISPQSRAATGVRVQRLDQQDAIAAVALVPPSEEGDDDDAEDLEV
jgi:DNA gyrase subunit A